MSTARIYLASASPRRRELLDQIGIGCALLTVDVDESLHASETPQDYVQRLALAKACAGRELVTDAAERPVLGADTAVVVDGGVLGKPRDREEGLAMLARLSGRTHEVMSAVALAGTETAVRLSVSRVSFRIISDAERLTYWDTGEPLDKAGAYGIQGRAGIFVERLEGSYSGVVGLPLYETWELLRMFSIEPLQTGAAAGPRPMDRHTGI